MQGALQMGHDRELLQVFWIGEEAKSTGFGLAWIVVLRSDQAWIRAPRSSRWLIPQLYFATGPFVYPRFTISEPECRLRWLESGAPETATHH